MPRADEAGRCVGRRLPDGESIAVRSEPGTDEDGSGERSEMAYSFVTVAHADDEWLLRLQARSMRLHLAPALAGEIVVVENFGIGPPVAWRDRLHADYGQLADRVRFVPSAVLGPMPSASGWWTQQALKLLVSRTVACRRYVVLDAKNHLVRPMRRDFLEGIGGRMRARRYDYRRHPLRHFLERTLLACDLPLEPHVGWFMQAGTPFTIDRADAREVIDVLEARTGKRFAEALIDSRMTEFFLLAGHLVRRGVLEDRYDFSQVACPVVWDKAALPASVLSAIRDAEDGRAPFFAVHRGVIPKLDDVSREILARFWMRHGLFDSTAEAVADLVRGSAATLTEAMETDHPVPRSAAPA